MRNLMIILGFIGLVLAGCSDDQGTGATPAAKAPVAPSASGSSPGKSAMGSGVIDHSQDEIEFLLRRELGGVERMLEHYKTDGYDTAELEARQAELEKQLDKMSG